MKSHRGYLWPQPNTQSVALVTILIIAMLSRQIHSCRFKRLELYSQLRQYVTIFLGFYRFGVQWTLTSRFIDIMAILTPLHTYLKIGFTNMFQKSYFEVKFCRRRSGVLYQNLKSYLNCRNIFEKLRQFSLRITEEIANILIFTIFNNFI